MITVCIESPLKGDYDRNHRYALECLKYCLQAGVAPFASHLLYPMVLRDTIENERRLGMNAGHVMGDRCDERWFFVNHGWSTGMEEGFSRAVKIGQRFKVIMLDDFGNGKVMDRG